MNQLDNSSDVIKQRLDTERQLISLMLEYPDIVSEMYEGGIGPQYFDATHIPIVQAIYWEYSQSNGKRLLTDTCYRNILAQQGKPLELAHSMSIFYAIKYGDVINKDNFDFLKTSLINFSISQKNIIAFRKFNENVETIGHLNATRQLCEELSDVIRLNESKRLSFITASDFRESYLDHLKTLAESSDDVVGCGLPEIDDSVLSGFKPGQMTLVVGAPGSHKTNLMLNLSLNINRLFHLPVLYVSLEMSKEDLTHRILSNRTGVAFAKIVRPKALDKEEREKLSQSDWWTNANFAILDITDGISVLTLKRELEKRMNIFAPKLIVVDYLSLIRSDVAYSNRHDLELGNIAKELRFIGRSYGAHILTAAQMGRSDIRRIREQGTNAFLDTTSVSGSQEVPAHSDNVFALTAVPDVPNILRVHIVKCRNGIANVTRKLHVDPSCAKITSTSLVSAMDGTTDAEWDSALNGVMTTDSHIPNLSDNVDESHELDFDSMNLDDLG